MAFNIELLDGWVKIDFRDTVTVADVQELLRMADDLEAKAPVTPNRVTDLTEVEGFRVDFQTAERNAARRCAMTLKNPIKSAIVAPKPFQYGFARMYQALVNHPSIQIRLFRDLESAERWVKEPGLT